MGGILWRCFLWAALRSYSLVVSIALLLLGLFLLRTGYFHPITDVLLGKCYDRSHAYWIVGMAIFGFLVAAGAWLYKPKASPDRIETYISVMSSHHAGQGSSSEMQLPPLEDTTPSKTRPTAVIDMVRPINQYHALTDTQSSSTAAPQPSAK